MNLEQTKKRVEEIANHIANEIGGTIEYTKTGYPNIIGKKKDWVYDYAGYDPERIYICEPNNDYELTIGIHMAQVQNLLKMGYDDF